MLVDEIISKIRGSKWDDGYIIEQIKHDFDLLGEDIAMHYAKNFSPSKLGRMGYLGLRKLAIIRRDDPEFFKELF